MFNEAFSLRTAAYEYVQFVSRWPVSWGGLTGYQGVLDLALLSVCGATTFLARREGRTPRGWLRLTSSPAVYCLLVLMALFLARLPAFVFPSLNPDESLFVAGARKLGSDPIFWNSLDGTTSGPLNFYPLTLLSFAGLPFDFATARLLNVLCVGGAISMLYLSARFFLGDWVARLSVLPPLAAAMYFGNADFLHYSSECVPVLLISIAVWLIFSLEFGQRGMWRYAVFGAIVSALPFAKLQTAPIAATLALLGLARAISRYKDDKWAPLGSLAAGMAGFCGLLIAFLSLFHVWKSFWESYILSSLQYVSTGYQEASTLARFFRYCLYPPDVRWYHFSLLLYGLFAGCVVLAKWVRRRSGPLRLHWPRFSFVTIFVLSLLVATLYAIHKPLREFPHYLVLLLFPMALSAAWMLALSAGCVPEEVGSAPRPVRGWTPVVMFLALAVLLPVAVRSKKLKNEDIARAAEAPRSLSSPASELLSHFARPGQPVAIWGWEPELYVVTGTIPATRDALTAWQIWEGPQREYYRRRFLEDFRRNPPVVFADAVGPGRFVFTDRASDGFETLAELRDLVASKFSLAGEVDGVRVYIKK